MEEQGKYWILGLMWVIFVVLAAGAMLTHQSEEIIKTVLFWGGLACSYVSYLVLSND